MISGAAEPGETGEIIVMFVYKDVHLRESVWQLECVRSLWIKQTVCAMFMAAIFCSVFMFLCYNDTYKKALSTRLCLVTI